MKRKINVILGKNQRDLFYTLLESTEIKKIDEQFIIVGLEADQHEIYEFKRVLDENGINSFYLK